MKAVIVGGGLSGLVCARELVRTGHQVVILEKEDFPGGRVATDTHEGFLLDRGFQVYLDAYTAPTAFFQLKALRPGKFPAGAWIHRQSGWKRVADPFRDPLGALPTLFSGALLPGDALKVLKMRRQCMKFAPRLLDGEIRKLTSLQYLRAMGFSDRIIEGFFRPFLGGIFLDPTLKTSAAMLVFVYGCFSRGYACLPEKGMGAIPAAIASELPAGTLKTQTTVTRIREREVQTASGQNYQGDVTILALPPWQWKTIEGLEDHLPETVATSGIVTDYWSLDQNIKIPPGLMLCQPGDKPYTHLALISAVQPSYAPPGKHLLAAMRFTGYTDPTPPGEDALQQLQRLFPHRPEFLKSYAIPCALPDRSPPNLPEEQPFATLKQGLYACGDHWETASIQGAVLSGAGLGRHLAEKAS